METRDILEIAWIYILALAPAMLMISIVAVTEDIIIIFKRAISGQYTKRNQY